MSYLISIIVPMYNCEKTIERLLESIMLQSYQDFELILVDDGCTDNTFSIASNFCIDDNRVHIFRQKNMGAPSARNVGIENANGKYIYFCDADDILYPNTLECLSKEIELNQADLAIGKKAILNRNDKKLVINKICAKRSFQLGDLRYFMCDPVPGTKIFKREIIEKNGIRYSDVKIGQDASFYLKYLLVCNKVAECDKPIYIYCICDDSISRTYKLETLLDIMNSMKLVAEFAQKNNIDNYHEKEKILNYVKMCHYLNQLKKKKHMKKSDYILLKNSLIQDISIKYDKKLLRACWVEYIEFIFIKYFNIVLRNG